MRGVKSKTWWYQLIYDVLRHYDEIGLLKPLRTSSAGYRIYGAREVELLQQILLYRELGVELEAIRQIIYARDFQIVSALQEHLSKLEARKAELVEIIENVQRTIASHQGGITMADQAKFKGLKKTLIEENEQKYGAEIRAKYGDDTIDRSNRKVKGMSEQQFAEAQSLSVRLNETIAAAMQNGDPAGELARIACELHKTWLMNYWDFYSPEAHMGLAQMYVDDERFRANYEQIAPGAAEFFRDAMRHYTGVDLNA